MLCWRNTYLSQGHGDFLPMLFSVFYLSCFGSVTHLEFIFVCDLRFGGRDLFSWWIFSWPSTVYCKNHLFFTACLCHESSNHTHVGLFLWRNIYLNPLPNFAFYGVISSSFWKAVFIGYRFLGGQLIVSWYFKATVF